MIMDTELLKDISVLFDKKFILYGAGYFGARTAEWMEGIGCKILSFCDSKPVKASYCGYPVIPPDELRNLCEAEDACIAITTSSQYYDEIEATLNQLGCPAVRYTQFGIIHSIQLNINDKRISQDYRDSYLKLRDAYRKIVLSPLYILQDIMEMPLDNSVHIYQVGKVGSSTLRASLTDAGIHTTQMHRLMDESKLKPITTAPPRNASIDELYTICIDLIKSRKNIKIITLIREPIARDISNYFQFLSREYIMNDYLMSDIYQGAIQNLDRTSSVGKYGYTFEWFDDELKALTGVDIFDYPFNRDLGYSIIKEANVEILVLKTEMMNRNIDIIGDFVGVSNFKLINRNQGNQKAYKYVYQDVMKDLKIPKAIVDRYYDNNERMDYFYTEEEKAKFLDKYTVI